MNSKITMTAMMLAALLCLGAKPKQEPAVVFNIDASMVPTKKDWAEKKLKPELESWAKNVVTLLDGKGAKWTRGDVTLILDPEDGVASAVAATCTIRLHRKFAEDDPEGAKGACIHEFAHIVQDYRPAPGRAEPYVYPPGWLVEGIADWVRWFNYEGKAGIRRANADAVNNPKHDAAYGVTASFLDYIAKKYDREFVTKLNKVCREGKYSEEVWTTFTKKTREELAKEWARKIGGRRGKR